LPWVVWIAGVPLAALLASLAAAQAAGTASPIALAALSALATGLALLLGALELMRFAARADPAFLMVGAAVGASGLARAVGLVALAGTDAGDAWQRTALWSDWGAHATLPAVLLLGVALLPEGDHASGRRVHWFLGTAALVAGLAISLPWWAPVSPLAPAGLTLRQPLALWPAMLCALALLAWLRRPRALSAPLGRGLAAALYVAMVAQVLLDPYVAGAAGQFRLAVATADLIAVLAVTWGVVANVGADTRRAARNLERLAGEAVERERAESALALEAARLVRSNENLREFAYVASHDLQEPLRMISSYLQLVEKRYGNALDDDGREFIAFAVDGAVRMKQLINDLLVFSRVDTKGREPAPTAAEAVLEDTLKDLEVAVAESGAEVTYDPLPTVRVDGRQLGQLFQNLIGNAIKFRRPDARPRVHVTAEREEGGWRFSVRDNGIGIDAKYADRVFGVFQRLHGGSTYSGSGIGLAVARKIVERHGGRIWVDSETKEGTCMVWTLPDSEARPPSDRPDEDPALRERVRSLIERAAEVL